MIWIEWIKVYFYFILVVPILKYRINNQNVALSANITFGTETQLNITCISINSRPSVSIDIFDPVKNISLPRVASTVALPNPFVLCDSSGMCQSTLRVYLTTGFASINNIREISCSAKNITLPYNVHNSINNLLDFNGKIENTFCRLRLFILKRAISTL